MTTSLLKRDYDKDEFCDYILGEVSSFIDATFEIIDADEKELNQCVECFTKELVEPNKTGLIAGILRTSGDNPITAANEIARMIFAARANAEMLVRLHGYCVELIEDEQ